MRAREAEKASNALDHVLRDDAHRLLARTCAPARAHVRVGAHARVVRARVLVPCLSSLPLIDYERVQGQGIDSHSPPPPPSLLSSPPLPRALARLECVGERASERARVRAPRLALVRDKGYGTRDAKQKFLSKTLLMGAWRVAPGRCG